MPCYRADGTLAGEHVWGGWEPDGPHWEIRRCEQCGAPQMREVARDG